MSGKRWLILACATWLLGCEAGPIGREYWCFPDEGSGQCVCESDVPHREESSVCEGDCCFVQRTVRSNEVVYECKCSGDDGAGFVPPADVCLPRPGYQPVDACPPTRFIGEPVSFVCADEPSDQNALAIGFGLPCDAPEATEGCLLSVGNAGAVCQAISQDDDCLGIRVTGCDDNLAFQLTRTVVEGWECTMLPSFPPYCSCAGPYSTQVEGGYYSPRSSYPCPPIPDQCCAFDSSSCKCTSGDACANLQGAEVSACPPPEAELRAIQDAP
jgi:hypothetical protein